MGRWGGGGWREGYFGPGNFFFAHRSLAFYFLHGSVLDFFSDRIMCIKQNKKVFYISANSDLEIVL